MPEKKYYSKFSEIYLISLDIFLLLATMGISLGILFFVINPSLRFSEPAIPGTFFIQTISKIDYNYLNNNTQHSNIDEIFKKHLKEGDIFQYIVNSQDKPALYQVSYLNGIKYTLEGIFLIRQRWVDIGFFLTIERKNIYDLDILRGTNESEKIQIEKDIKKWPELSNILNL